MCIVCGYVSIGNPWSLLRMVRYLGSSFLAISWLHICGNGL